MPGHEVIYHVKTNKPIIALTFDIAHGEKVPRRVLDVLKKEKLKKATFFLCGAWVEKQPAIARTIHRMGYELASHGHLHRNYSRYTNAWISRQVKKASRAIYRTTGVYTKMIRTPSGDFNGRVIRLLRSLGYTVIQWDTDSLDWKMPGVKQIVNRVISRVHPGDIVLLHACDPWIQTIEALPPMLRALRRKGYRFVTVSELLKEGGHRYAEKT